MTAGKAATVNILNSADMLEVFSYAAGRILDDTLKTVRTASFDVGIFGHKYRQAPLTARVVAYDWANQNIVLDAKVQYKNVAAFFGPKEWERVVRDIIEKREIPGYLRVPEPKRQEE